MLASLPAQEFAPCADGRYAVVTPFNQSNPCGDREVTDPDPPLPGFIELFGSRPVGGSVEDRQAKVLWDQDRKYFGGLIDPTAAPGFDGKRYTEALKLFIEWGMGEPVFWQRLQPGGGSQVWAAFPSSFSAPRFTKRYASAWTVFHAPAVVIAVAQIEAIHAGVFVEKVHPWLPNSTRRQNEALAR